MTIRKQSSRRRAGAIAAATAITSLAAMGAAAPAAHAWDPARFWGCDWKYKGWNAASELTITYRVENQVPSNVLTGIKSWDAPLTHVKLVQVTSGADFTVRVQSGMPAGVAGEVLRSDTLRPPCSGGGTNMPKGLIQVRINTAAGSKLTASQQRGLGAHEMGHVLGMAHYDALGYYGLYTSVLGTGGASNPRMPATPTSIDIADADGYYGPRLK